MHHTLSPTFDRPALSSRTAARACVSFAAAVSILGSTFTGTAAPAPESFADLAEQLLPSVVNISSTQAAAGAQFEIPQAPPGSPFEDFFRDFFERNRPRNAPRRAASLGSGFIIDSTGYIVTNNHVITEADEISVILQDDTKYAAELIGIDEKTDLALLKIEPDRDLPALRWGDSDVSRVGDWVMAIGNPFGLGGSVTAGIISARARDINAGPYDNFIQTDASINRGNSGGPLFNLAGEVIGINTAIFSPSGGSVGIGFAVPSSIAFRVIEQLRDFGRTKRGWLGVRIQSVTDEIAESLGLDRTRGALVASVTEGGPAEGGGIEAGDVILSFDGRDIEQMRELPRFVAETEVGSVVDVEVWRKGAQQRVEISLGELEAAEELAALPGADIPDDAVTGSIGSIGVGLAALTDELRLEYSLADDVAGVLVTEVDENSPAAEKGIQAGDVIVEVSQEEVSLPAHVQSRVQAAKESGRRSVLLLIGRDGDLRFVAVRVNEG